MESRQTCYDLLYSSQDIPKFYLRMSVTDKPYAHNGGLYAANCAAVLNPAPVCAFKVNCDITITITGFQINPSIDFYNPVLYNKESRKANCYRKGAGR